MNTQPVVRSLLENDLYKFTMWQALLHSHPNTHTEYAFVCRNAPAYPLTELQADIERELDRLCTMSFADDELDYLRGLRFIKSDFVDFLTVFRFQRKFVRVDIDGEQLIVRAKGPQVHVMAFEIFVLYIVNELYFRRFDQQAALDEGRRRLAAKVQALRDFGREPAKRNPFEFFDFGVRRRFSGAWHDEVVATLAREVPQFFKGTSNVYLAKKFGLVPIGTMAHEYLQSYQSFGVRLRDFQKAALEDWVQEFRGDLGTALTDVVGMDAFLADFDLYFAKLFDGLRHDSGDPVMLGREGAGALRQTAHRRANQAAGVFRRPGLADGVFAVPAFRRPHHDRLRHRHQSDQRYRHYSAEYRDEAGVVQRPAGGETVGRQGQDLVLGRNLPRLFAQGFQAPRALTDWET